MTNFVKLFKAARRVSTPIVWIKTPDQAMTIKKLTAALVNGNTPAIMTWDCVRGCIWENEKGMEVCWQILLGKQRGRPMKAEEPQAIRELAMTAEPVGLLERAQEFPEDSVLFIKNAHLFWEGKPSMLQAAWNLRDTFKRNFRTLVLLTDAGATLPPTLRDALPLTEELPTLEELEEIVASQGKAAGMKPEEIEPINAKAVDAVCGLPAFSAEQSIAMSFVIRDKKVTLDIDAAWERKREMIEQTPGLSVWRGDDNFAGLGGLAIIKKFSLEVVQGEDGPRLIVFMDEIEKAFAGASEGNGDSSGSTQEMHGTLLSEMQNQEYPGEIIVGPPGTGKSQFAKALAGEAGIPLVVFDISSMKSKFVGSSNANLNTALAVIRAVSQGKAMFIATCNAVAALPPELKRRFTLATFFMDLPSDEEKAPIWKIYIAKYDLNVKQGRPDDDGWTGADIKQCCQLAWRLRKPLLYAAQYLTPVAQTDAARIDRLRRESSGKYLSASYEGKYRYGGAEASMPAVSPTTGTRRIRVEEESK